MCKLNGPFTTVSFSKVSCLYAWQDSSGTPRWCAGTAPCSRRSRHFLPAALWCSSPSPSATGSMPSWAAIIHWRKSTNGTPRGASLSHPRSWISRRRVRSLWFPLTTGCSCSHPASRGKLRYTSTSWSIWVIETHPHFATNHVHYHSNAFLLLSFTTNSHFSLNKSLKQKLQLS